MLWTPSRARLSHSTWLGCVKVFRRPTFALGARHIQSGSGAADALIPHLQPHASVRPVPCFLPPPIVFVALKHSANQQFDYVFVTNMMTN